eukprot:scaffold245857_cov56-Attheya_sp.AAC.1
MLWTKLMIEAQGFKIKNLAHRDNTSSMKLEANGKSSSGKRTRHFNIKYFYVTDLCQKRILISTCNETISALTGTLRDPGYTGVYRQLIQQLR